MFSELVLQPATNEKDTVHLGDIQSLPIHKAGFIGIQSFNGITNFGLVKRGSCLSRLGHLRGCTAWFKFNTPASTPRPLRLA